MHLFENIEINPLKINLKLKKEKKEGEEVKVGQ